MVQLNISFISVIYLSHGNLSTANYLQTSLIDSPLLPSSRRPSAALWGSVLLPSLWTMRAVEAKERLRVRHPLRKALLYLRPARGARLGEAVTRSLPRRGLSLRRSAGSSLIKTLGRRCCSEPHVSAIRWGHKTSQRYPSVSPPLLMFIEFFFSLCAAGRGSVLPGEGHQGG